MTVEDRLKIVDKIAQLCFSDTTDIIIQCVIEELRYVSLKTSILRIRRDLEVNKVLNAYNITTNDLPNRVQQYIKRLYGFCEDEGLVAHYDLNDYVSYIGEYYDGEPTAKYRKKGRYPIEPIR